MHCLWNVTWRVDIGSAFVDRGQLSLMYLLLLLLGYMKQIQASFKVMTWVQFSKEIFPLFFTKGFTIEDLSGRTT